jgi:hypothetical protein
MNQSMPMHGDYAFHDDDLHAPLAFHCPPYSIDLISNMIIDHQYCPLARSGPLTVTVHYLDLCCVGVHCHWGKSREFHPPFKWPRCPAKYHILGNIWNQISLKNWLVISKKICLKPDQGHNVKASQFPSWKPFVTTKWRNVANNAIGSFLGLSLTKLSLTK